MFNRHHSDAPDLEPIVTRLKAERPQLSAIELDEIGRRIRSRAADPARRRTRRMMVMKSRLAMVLMVAFGVMVSGTGAGLAFQGGTGNGNAAQEQYPEEQPRGGVLGEEDAGVTPRDGGGVAGEEDAPAPTQVERQVAVGVQGGDSELPFTGLAAIPIIVLGVAMTVSGVVLRRRLGRDGA
jgi:hypothetical protein